MILVLGGTSDALEIAGKIYGVTKEVIVSTATEYGFEVSRERFPGRIIYGRMERDDLKSYLLDNKIRLVVDATHPYAENVSKKAISVCQELGIEYCRFERPVIDQNSLDDVKDDDLVFCSSYEEAGILAEKSSGNIFITIGINNIGKVLERISDKGRVRVRVLPQSETVAKLEGLGLNADHIIAMKGPYSEEMNYLMLKESKAGVLVLKDSGTQGGTDQKISAARKMGIKIIMVKRPQLDYPNKFSDEADLIAYLCYYLPSQCCD